jgi:hypothetical protein
MSNYQGLSLGAPPKDLGVNVISTGHVTSKLASSIEHIDTNVVEIEKDIFDLQEIVLQNTEDVVRINQDVTATQDELVQLRYTQTLPWFCKSNFSYGEVKSENWDSNLVPDASNQMFVRYVDLPDTLTGMILFLPKSEGTGESRHISVSPRSSEACVYVNTNPEDAVRLSSFDIEWFPPLSDVEDTNLFVGHAALLSKSNKMNGYIFGSTAESNGPGQCVVFPNAGSFYIQSIYIDNTQGNSRLMLVGQKYRNTQNKFLDGFAYYGFQ